MPLAYIGLGSNLGSRLSYIKKAIEGIRRLETTEVLRSSAIYETEPWGNSEQERYLNSVIKIKTDLKPEMLLRKLKNLENEIGRENRGKWTAREIDIDILFYDAEIIKSGLMKIPHPQIENRRFVLVPLNEIAPELVHPELNKNVSKLLEETSDNLGVVVYINEET